MVVGVGSKSIPGNFLEVINQQGWQGLWAGNTINMLRIIPTQAIELGTFEWVKRTMTLSQEKWHRHGDPKIQFGDITLSLPLSWLSPVGLAGAAAGIAGTLACHPLEVVKVLELKPYHVLIRFSSCVGVISKTLMFDFFMAGSIDHQTSGLPEFNGCTW